MRYIGVDLHKTNFVVCFLTADDKSQLERFDLDHHGLARFKRKLRKDDLLAVEASANAFYFYSQIRGCVSEIKVVDTYRFAVIARSKKKTDKKDAAMLAGFLKLGWLPEVPVPTQQVQQLRHLLQARESMVGMLVQLKNMAHASLVRSGYAYGRAAFKSKRARARLLSLEQLSAVDRQVLDMTIRQMEQIEGEVARLEQEIIERGKSLEGLKRLLQIHGLNLLAAIGLLAEIGDIGLFDESKQLVAYAGLHEREAIERDNQAREDNKAGTQAAADYTNKNSAINGESHKDAINGVLSAEEARERCGQSNSSNSA